MPAIKPRTTQKHLVRRITRLYRDNNETLFAYAQFIGEPTEYVVNQLITTVLAKDNDFQSWLADNPGSHVPAPGSRPRGRHRPFARPTPSQAQPTPVAVGSDR